MLMTLTEQLVFLTKTVEALTQERDEARERLAYLGEERRQLADLLRLWNPSAVESSLVSRLRAALDQAAEKRARDQQTEVAATKHMLALAKMDIVAKQQEIAVLEEAVQHHRSETAYVKAHTVSRDWMDAAIKYAQEIDKARRELAHEE